MTDIKGRLGRSVAVLAVIDDRRRQSCDPQIGVALERFIIERELKELAEEAAAAPPRGFTASSHTRQRRPVLLTRAGRWLRWSSR